MTTVIAALDGELPVAAEYIPGVRGHAVVAVGPDGAGDEALAVWRLGPTGAAGGAWVLPMDAITGDPQHVERVISTLRGRCLVDWTADRSVAILENLRPALSDDLVTGLAAGIVLFPDLLAEIQKSRQRCIDAVEAYQATATSKIAPLSWERNIPADPGQALHLLTIRQPGAASEVAAEALRLTAVTQQVVELWRDTEQVRFRRPYLRPLGEPQPLPACWLARLREAATNPVTVR